MTDNNNMTQSTTTTHTTSSEIQIPQFPLAGQPDIIRSVQKDEYYSRVLFDYMKEVGTWLFGTRNVMKYEQEIELCAQLMYYSCTMFQFRSPQQDQQTLGEEYCDLIQCVNHRHHHGDEKNAASALALSENQNLRMIAAPAINRIAFILLQTLVPYIWNKKSCQSWLNKCIHQCYDHYHYYNNSQTKKSQDKAQMTSPSYPKVDLEKMVQFLLKFHLAVFYMSGSFLNVSKRLTGIRYMFTGTSEMQRPTYRILGVLIFTQQFVSLCMYIAKVRRERRLRQLINDGGGSDEDEEGAKRHKKAAIVEYEAIDDSNGASPSSESDSLTNRCSLCLDRRKQTTATSCGHLFCWLCIAECCTNTVSSSNNPIAKCPICRQDISLQTLTRVYHFDSNE